MVAEGQQLTTKQKALADALIADPSMTQRAAAKKAGMHEVQASRVLSGVKVPAYIERKTARQADKARALAEKALDMVGDALDEPQLDGREKLERGGMAIVATAKYAESWGEGVAAVPGAAERAEYRRMQRRKQLLAVRVCQRWPGAVEAYRARANPNG